MRMAAAMARAWKLKPLAICGLGETPPADSSLPWFKADDYVHQILAARVSVPSFAVDLSAGQPGLPLCRELLERLRVPTISSSAVALPRSFVGRPDVLRATTESELWESLRFLACEPDETVERAFNVSWADQETDAGWAWIWRYCLSLFETRDAQFT